MYPDDFKDMNWMMGPLHIGMAFMAVIGDWLEESGWDTVFVKSNINTSDRAQSFLWGNKVKRSRYAHQVSLAALIQLIQESFSHHGDEQQLIEDWLANKTENSVNATLIMLDGCQFSFLL